MRSCTLSLVANCANGVCMKNILFSSLVIFVMGLASACKVNSVPTNAKSITLGLGVVNGKSETISESRSVDLGIKFDGKDENTIKILLTNLSSKTVSIKDLSIAAGKSDLLDISGVEKGQMLQAQEVVELVLSYCDELKGQSADVSLVVANDAEEIQPVISLSEAVMAPELEVSGPPHAKEQVLTVQYDVPNQGILTAYHHGKKPLHFSIVSQGEQGTVVITDPSNGTFTYTSSSGAKNPMDTFVFSVSDGTEDEGSPLSTAKVILQFEPRVHQVCTPNQSQSVNCTADILNAALAAKTSTCDSKGSGYLYGTCQAKACKAGFTVSGNACEPLVCTGLNQVDCKGEIANSASAFKLRMCNPKKDGYTYASCQVTACAPGYALHNNSCSKSYILSCRAEPSSSSSKTSCTVSCPSGMKISLKGLSSVALPANHSYASLPQSKGSCSVDTVSDKGVCTSSLVQSPSGIVPWSGPTGTFACSY